MQDLHIPKDRIGRINDLLFACLDPAFHALNRYNHGYAMGVIATLDLVYDEKHPKLDVGAYTEELTADSNLGVEALKLIESWVTSGELSGPERVTTRYSIESQMAKIIEAWKANTWTKAHMPVLTEKKVIEVTLRLPDGKVEKVHGPGELFSIPAVEEASTDYGHMFFRRLGLIKHLEHFWLYAEFCNDKGDEQSHTRIGQLTGDIESFNLPNLCPG